MSIYESDFRGAYDPATNAIRTTAASGASSTPGDLPYPANSTVLTGSSGNVAATATTATLTGAAAVTTYITGFTVTGAGATGGSVILITVTGTIGGTLTYTLTIPSGATTAVTPLDIQFNTPVPSSAVNTSIVVNVPSFGAGSTNAAVVATGFRV